MQSASGFSMPRMTSFVRKLLIGLFGCYVAQLVLGGWLGMPLAEMLAMEPGGSSPWQLVTYVVVEQQNPLWFLFGMLFLWWILAPFEVAFGPRRTMQLCITVTLAASVPAWLMGFVFPSPLLFGTGPVWFGAMAATTWLYRDRQMSLFGLASMTSQQFLGLMLGLSVLMFLFSHNHTHFVADLGGMGGGIGFIQWLRRAPSGSRPGRASRKARRSGPGLRVIKGGQDDDDPPKWLN